MNPKATKMLLLGSILVLLLSTPAHAQVVGASLSGTITDASGGVIPGAKVSVRNAATNSTETTTTNSSGFYSMSNLTAADYEVSISAPGFGTAVSKLTLTVGKQQELSLALKVGQVTEAVTITGAAPAVETTNSTLSAEVNATTVEELPLNGRDWASLAALQPGVAGVRTQELITQVGAVGRGLGTQMSINGGRPTQNSYRLNGVIINDYSNAGPGNVLGGNLGVDAIQEFSVLTSNYSSEYGYTSGGVVNAITKSGTNQFHGTGFEFIRDQSLDAANFFENVPGGTGKQPFRRNQFGGSAGGPIKKDKIFIFGAYEGLRQHKGIPHSAIGPSSDALKGDLHDPSDPLGIALLPPTLMGTGGANPPCAFGTNLDPGRAHICVFQPYLTFFQLGGAPCPIANNIGPAQGGDNNTCQIHFSGNQVVPDNFYNFKGDVKLSDKDSMSASFYYDRSTFTQPDNWNQVLDGFFVGRKGLSVEETHIFGASVANTARFGWNFTQGFGQLTPGVINPNAASTDTTKFAIEAGLHAARIATIGGGPGVGNFFDNPFAGGLNGNAIEDFTHTTFQFYDDAAKTIGTHSLKFGFMYIHLTEQLYAPFTSNGTANFNALPNGETALSAFLQDIPVQVQGPPLGGIKGVTTLYDTVHIPAFYIQDDWKLRPNLTLNLGLRYEMMTIPTERHGHIANLPLLTTNPTTITCSACSNKMFARNPTTKNFEPRVGFAWDPFHSGKTSVRGGFGIFDALPLPYELMLNQAQTAPLHLNVTVPGCVFVAPGTTCIGQGEFPAVNAAVANQFNNLAAVPIPGVVWNYVEPNLKRNYVYQWNLNIQREITPSLSMTVTYAGSRGKHNPFQTDDLNTVFPKNIGGKNWLFPTVLTTVVDTNPNPLLRIPIGTPVVCGNPLAPPTALNAGFCNNPFNPPSTCGVGGCTANQFINPNIAEDQSTIWQSKSWYDSLQVEVNKRMSHGFQIQASFTWSKSEDTSSGSFAGDNFAGDVNPTIPWWDLRLIKGLSDFNISRNLVVNGLWKVPTPASFNGPAGWIARGWEIGGIVSLSDGVPAWPFGIQGDLMGQQNSEPLVLPSVVPGCKLINPSSGRHGTRQYINPACFVNAVAPTNVPGFNAATQCDQGFLIVNPTLPKNTCINLLGNIGRNIITGPGLINFDYSMTKNNPIRKISENFNIQFRAEFFNIFNRANFAPPGAGNLSPFDANGNSVGGFGTLTTTQTPERQIQFGIKVSW